MMLIETAYRKRLGTPRQHTTETEETSAPADEHDVFCRYPTPGFVDITSWVAVSGRGIIA